MDLWANSQSMSYVKHLDNGLREAHDIHGNGHSIGKGEDKADGASELWPQTPGDQIIRSSCDT